MHTDSVSEAGSLCPTCPLVLSSEASHPKTLLWHAFMPYCLVCSTPTPWKSCSGRQQHSQHCSHFWAILLPTHTHQSNYLLVPEELHVVPRSPVGPGCVTQVPGLLVFTGVGDSCYSSKWSLEKASVRLFGRHVPDHLAAYMLMYRTAFLPWELPDTKRALRPWLYNVLLVWSKAWCQYQVLKVVSERWPNLAAFYDALH